nr:DUF3841 domain-containing protein [Clostridium scatologenes]
MAKREYIERKMEDCAKYYFEVYSLYTRKASEIVAKPQNAYMSSFYTQLKNEIIKSWNRLLDNSYSLSSFKQGTILWKLEREWIVDIKEI